MNTFDVGALITTALTDLGADFAALAPVAVSISLAVFGVTWMLRKGKSVISS